MACGYARARTAMKVRVLLGAALLLATGQEQANALQAVSSTTPASTSSDSNRGDTRTLANTGGNDSVHVRFIDVDLNLVVQALAPYLDYPITSEGRSAAS